MNAALPNATFAGRASATAGELFGAGVIVLTLAALALVPGVNLAVLGYLLEVEGRLATGRRWHEALPGLRFAPRFAVAAVAGWLWLLPLRVLSGLADDAAWVQPGSGAAHGLELARGVAVVLVGLHVALSLLRGGGAGSFFRPLKTLGWAVRWLRSRDVEAPVVQSLRAAAEEVQPLALLAKGTGAAAAALVWLCVPVGLLWISRAGVARPGLGLLGIALLAPVLAVLPFTQARFAATGKVRALFDWRGARELWRNAPVSALLAHLALALLTLPLYMLTVVVAARDAMWPATLLFILALLPARAAVAFAFRRAAGRPRRASRWLRFPLAPVAVALLLAWAGLLAVTPLIDHRGPMGLSSQHAFLLPAPF